MSRMPDKQFSDWICHLITHCPSLDRDPTKVRYLIDSRFMVDPCTPKDFQELRGEMREIDT